MKVDLLVLSNPVSKHVFKTLLPPSRLFHTLNMSVFCLRNSGDSVPLAR